MLDVGVGFIVAIHCGVGFVVAIHCGVGFIVAIHCGVSFIVAIHCGVAWPKWTVLFAEGRCVMHLARQWLCTRVNAVRIVRRRIVALVLVQLFQVNG